MSELLWLPLFAMGLSALVIRVRLRFAAHGLDAPGHRSLHVRATPHGGGLGIVAAALAAGAWLGMDWPWLVGVALLALISLIDDWRHLPFWVRLPVHLACAALVVFSQTFPGVASALVLVLVIGWAINAYNFMDGADGLAGSMAAVGFSTYALGFQLAGAAGLAIFCAVVAAASLAFLCFNWHPARIFMGDVGSVPLGFLAAGLGWQGVQAGVWPGWFPLLVFAPFLCDASVTLARRAMAGKRVWEAHREHYYQRTVRMGETHDAMVLRWLGVMLLGACVALGLLALDPLAGWFGAVAWMMVLFGLGRGIDRRWAEKQEQVMNP